MEEYARGVRGVIYRDDAFFRRRAIFGQRAEGGIPGGRGRGTKYVRSLIRSKLYLGRRVMRGRVTGRDSKDPIVTWMENRC